MSSHSEIAVPGKAQETRSNLGLFEVFFAVTLLCLGIGVFVPAKDFSQNGLVQGAEDFGGAETAPSPKRNLLLLTVDTLRADHLGAYGYDRRTSTVIDHWSKQAALYEQAYSSSSWTLPSFASMLTGLEPSSHGATHFFAAVPDAAQTLAEAMQGQGLRTHAVVSHLFTGSKFGFAQGFDEFDESLVHETLDQSHRAISSPRVAERGLAFLREVKDADDHWFLWLHFFDPHSDYQDHEGHSFGNEKLDRYDSEISFTDESIGRVLEGLQELGLQEDTIVCLTADHGEALGDHGHHGHLQSLYDEVLHVPFAISGPGIVPARYTNTIGTIDLTPTLADLVGVGLQDGDQLAGTSCASQLLGGWDPDAQAGASRGVLSELGRRQPWLQSWTQAEWKLVLNRETGRRQLFRRSDDPREERDLSQQLPERAARMELALERELDEARDRAALLRERTYELEQQDEDVSDASAADLSHDEQAALRSLGYLGVGGDS